MTLAAANLREQNSLKGKLILDWLLFTHRLDWVEQQALLEAAREPPHSSVMLDPGASGQNDSYEESSAHFISHISDAHLLSDSRMTREDLKAIFIKICGGTKEGVPQRSLRGLLRQLIQLFGIEIRVESRSVRVALQSLRGWYQVTDRLDAEALLCFRLAELGFAKEIADLDQWPLVTLISDRDLDVLAAEGVSDMHQHLGGLRSAPIMWLQLMAGHLQTDQIPYFSQRAMEALTYDPQTLSRRLAEQRRIERLAAAHREDCRGILRRLFFEPLSQLRYCIDLQDSQPWSPQVIGQLVLQERVMLARGFQRLIQLSGQGAQGESRRLEHALDLYMHTKSHFISNHRQAVRSNPGLGRHRQYSDSTKLGWGWEARSSPPRNAELRSYDYSEAIYLLRQTPSLRRVELRLAPADTKLGYVDFLEAWGLAEKRLKRESAGRSAAPLPEIRFSIHFKRSLDRRGGNSLEDRLREFLLELDALSATLHEFRLDMHSDLSDRKRACADVWRIARIDFAGQERDIFPDRAAFAMNLLRTDERAVAQLADNAAGFRPSSVFHGRWLELKEKGRLHAPARLPQLGVTCHAGEDYAHPLEGIYAMITAVEALNMRAGDSIGHGLAIGRDVGRFHREMAPQIMTTKGGQFDALIWLQSTLVAHAPPDHMQAAAQIEEWCRRQAEEIYPKQKLPASSTAFLDVAKLRRGPIPEETRQPATLAAQIWWRECWDAEVQKVRRTPEPLASVLYEIEPSIVWSQEYVANEIARRGVVIEFNPSSNWRISQASGPGEIPFIAILRRFGNLLSACINTDNAGAYGTRIENEFAIALSGLMEAGISRNEAITILDRLRLTGLGRLH